MKFLLFWLKTKKEPIKECLPGWRLSWLDLGRIYLFAKWKRAEIRAKTPKTQVYVLYSFFVKHDRRKRPENGPKWSKAHFYDV